MIEEALENLKSGNYAAAEGLYRQMLQEEPENPEVLYMLALACQGQGQLDVADDLLTQALRVQPKNPTLHHTLGLIQLQSQKLNEAEKSFFTAVGIDPNFAAAQNGIAAVELARGRFAAAEQALRKALRADPDNLPVLLNMGIAMLEQERSDDAVSYLQRVIEEQPENYFALFHLGRAFMLSGNSGFAAGALEKAAKLQPGRADVIVLLAKAQSQNQQHNLAAQNYRRALDLGLENVETIGGMARALAASNRHRESEGAYLRALRLASAEQKESILLEFAAELLAQKRAAEAISRLQPLLKDAAELPRVTRMLAQAHLATGNAIAARDLLRSLLADGAPDHEARLLLARALRMAGEKEASTAQLDRLLNDEDPPIDALLFAATGQVDDGDLAGAIDRLRGVQRRHDLSHEQRQSAVSLLANALHSSGEYQSAWEQYLGLDTRAADLMQIQQEKALILEQDEPAETAMQRDVAWSWPPQPIDDGRPEPVFIIAWPGSGSDRLLGALSKHSNVRVIRDTLEAQRERRLLISHPQGKGPLNALTPAQIQMARRKYWRAIRRADQDAGEGLTIDAMSLTVEALPTIYRLFPQAHVLLLNAEPGDLALSWLQSSFGDQESMAKRYAQQFRMLQTCQQGVPLKYIEVESQRLLSEPDKALREVINALGLAWEPQVEEYFGSAGQRDQEPGSWRHYESWLQPVLEAFKS